MPLYMIERNFAEQIQPTPEISAAIKQVNGEVGINWLFSFLSADKRKTYCLYEAENPEAIREAARRLNIPAGRQALTHTTNRLESMLQPD